MTDVRHISIPSSESTTITIVGDHNTAQASAWAMPTSGTCSYTAPDDIPCPSAPLSDRAIELGNSLLTVVPEDAILRDTSGDI